MTNKEAIELIENEIGCVMDADNGCDRDCGKCVRVRKSEDMQQAFRMAIHSLENEECKDDVIKKQDEICEDAVSRKAVLGIIQNWDTDFCGSITDCIRELPSVQPQAVGEVASETKCSKSRQFAKDAMDKVMDEYRKIAVDWYGMIKEIEKINPVDYGPMYSYETHNGARDCKYDILRIINKYRTEDKMAEYTARVIKKDEVNSILAAVWQSKPDDADMRKNKRGKWLKSVDEERIVCLECGFDFYIPDGEEDNYRYCPQCGCRMEGVE